MDSADQTSKAHTTTSLHLNKSLRQLSRRLGVDRAVFFGVCLRIWQMAAGAISLLLIVRFMSSDVQGFYYTFGSVLALQSFVELGLYLVIINVASHEWASLSLSQDGRIMGDSEALSRLVSLGQLVFKWYMIGSVVFILLAGPVGYLFFSQKSYPGISWQAPWIVMVVLTGLLLLALPFNSILEGCNQVVNIQKFRLGQAILSSLAMWLTLALGGGLWAVVAFAGVGVLRDLYLLGVQYRRFFRPFLLRPKGSGMCWRTEIWPMQWRLGLSGLVSFFAFSLFNPVMFYYHGADVAGQMGMSLRIVTSIQAIALMWVYPKVPRFGMLIARKDFSCLDSLWLKTSLMSLIVITVGSVAVYMLVYFLNVFNVPLAERILPPLPIVLFLVAGIFMQVSQCQAAYLRAHKREPIVVMNVTCSILIGFMVWLLGSRFGPIGASASYLCIMACVVVPWITVTWFRCRAKWHEG